ncbi:MAG: hypothetical protein C4586_05840 [Anaerolineaceae bacterium]|jgi:flagellar biosynthesis/type III secretory pathway protein FliH|nr:MAG: hypothetical protein C4586_05840 [Anaerolineaceae bacterium]
MQLKDWEEKIVAILEENLNDEAIREFEGEILRLATRIAKEVVQKAIEDEKDSWASIVYCDIDVRH